MKLTLFRRKHIHDFQYSYMTTGESYTGVVTGFRQSRKLTGGYTMIMEKCSCGEFNRLVFSGKFNEEEAKRISNQ